MPNSLQTFHASQSVYIRQNKRSSTQTSTNIFYHPTQTLHIWHPAGRRYHISNSKQTVKLCRNTKHITGICRNSFPNDLNSLALFASVAPCSVPPSLPDSLLSLASLSRIVPMPENTSSYSIQSTANNMTSI